MAKVNAGNKEVTSIIKLDAPVNVGGEITYYAKLIKLYKTLLDTDTEELSDEYEVGKDRIVYTQYQGMSEAGVLDILNQEREGLMDNYTKELTILNLMIDIVEND